MRIRTPDPLERKRERSPAFIVQPRVHHACGGRLSWVGYRGRLQRIEFELKVREGTNTMLQVRYTGLAQPLPCVLRRTA